MSFLNYLFWDPSPEIFKIDLPFLHRGILWYGFLFALGFLVGYWIFLYLVRRYFLFFCEFRKEDIVLWSELIRSLRSLASSSPLFPLFSQLPTAIKTQCSHWKAGDEATAELKREVLKNFNIFLHSPNDCPEPRSRLGLKLLAFAKRHMPDTTDIKKKFYIEEALQGILPLKKRSVIVTEKVTIYVVLGALIGARLGDVLFYQDWAQIARYPLSIFEIWEGGLASHGGAVGILIAMGILARKIQIPFLRLLDLLVVPTALVGLFIRVGNFFNQEILGVPTQLPWGIVFGHPLGDRAIVPRHPVQLYEAVWYGIVFLFLFYYFRKHPSLEKPGRIAGWFLVLVFGMRFCIEFLKIEQSHLMHGHALLTMGQWLSIPMVLLGVYLLLRASNGKCGGSSLS